MLFERVQNFLKHAVDVLQDVIVPKPQNQISHRLQYPCPIHIFNGSCSMLSSIELNDETSIGTTKINNVTIDWHLSLEFQA